MFSNATLDSDLELDRRMIKFGFVPRLGKILVFFVFLDFLDHYCWYLVSQF
jgi:hypothetical protein